LDKRPQLDVVYELAPLPGPLGLGVDETPSS
jgi:hypothetical protein